MKPSDPTTTNPGAFLIGMPTILQMDTLKNANGCMKSTVEVLLKELMDAEMNIG
jgi:hypothetical protein